MSSPPIVTIITPSFNQAAFLPATLTSVAEQSYPFIEHLVRDGGSSDTSAAILAGAAPAAPPRRFDWRSERDGGQAAAINQAIDESTGEIICWVNSDDLLTSGAVERAVAHFERNPNHLMVYGLAQWIDEAGNPIGWYPTQPPGAAERFKDGCFICQPTVFLRREAFEIAGRLDASLFAAHDFDFWIRLFEAIPGRIGLIEAEQAQSRLHSATKTLSAWDKAAIEAMRVLHRHFGSAPAHWILSTITEYFDRHPSDTGRGGRSQARSFLRMALPLLDEQEADEVKRHLRHDRRLSAAGPGAAIAISPDGWANRSTAIRIRRTGQRVLTLRGLHANPGNALEVLTVSSGTGVLAQLVLECNGPFTWCIPLPPAREPGDLENFELSAEKTFTPALVESGSTDW